MRNLKNFLKNNMDKDEILTEETRKIVGYILAILEAENVSIKSKQNIKNILWDFKDNLIKKI